MMFSTQLLEQAAHLAVREPGRPKQVSLRRSVSAAYYALFHYLIERATRQMMAGRGGMAARKALSRSFSHRDMKAASKSFAAGFQALPKTTRTALHGVTFPPDLAVMAQTFVELQEARHAADYDLGQSVLRQDALTLVNRTRAVIAKWPAVENTTAGRYFMLALLVPGLLKER